MRRLWKPRNYIALFDERIAESPKLSLGNIEWREWEDRLLLNDASIEHRTFVANTAMVHVLTEIRSNATALSGAMSGLSCFCDSWEQSLQTFTHKHRKNR